LLLGGVALQDAFGVADQVRCALPDPGELGGKVGPWRGAGVATGPFQRPPA